MTVGSSLSGTTPERPPRSVSGALLPALPPRVLALLPPVLLVLRMMGTAPVACSAFCRQPPRRSPTRGSILVRDGCASSRGAASRRHEIVRGGSGGGHSLALFSPRQLPPTEAPSNPPPILRRQERRAITAETVKTEGASTADAGPTKAAVGGGAATTVLAVGGAATYIGMSCRSSAKNGSRSSGGDGADAVGGGEATFEAIMHGNKEEEGENIAIGNNDYGDADEVVVQVVARVHTTSIQEEPGEEVMDEASRDGVGGESVPGGASNAGTAAESKADGTVATIAKTTVATTAAKGTTAEEVDTDGAGADADAGTTLTQQQYSAAATDALDGLKFCSTAALFSVAVDLVQASFVPPPDGGGRSSLLSTAPQAWSLMDWANIVDGLGVLGFAVATWRMGRILRASLETGGADLTTSGVLLDVMGTMKRSWAYAAVSLGMGSAAVALGLGPGLGRDFQVSYGPAALAALGLVGGVALSDRFASWKAEAEDVVDGTVTSPTPLNLASESAAAIKSEGFAAARNMAICAGGFSLLGTAQLVALAASTDSLLEKAVGTTDVAEQWVITGLLVTLLEKTLPVVSSLASERGDDDESMYVALYEAKKGVYHQIGETLVWAAAFALLATLYNILGFDQ